MTDVYIWWQRYRLYRNIAMIFTFFALIDNAGDAGRLGGLTTFDGVLSFTLAITAGGALALLVTDWKQDRDRARRRHGRHSREEPADDGV